MKIQVGTVLLAIFAPTGFCHDHQERFVLKDDETLSLLVGLKIVLDHEEMHRIFTPKTAAKASSRRGGRNLRESAQELREKSTAHLGPCKRLFAESVAASGLTSEWAFSKDDVYFTLSGSVTSFQQLLAKDNDGNPLRFVRHPDEATGRDVIRIQDPSAGRSDKLFQDDLMECVGYIGSFKPYSKASPSTASATRKPNRSSMKRNHHGALRKLEALDDAPTCPVNTVSMEAGLEVFLNRRGYPDDYYDDYITPSSIHEMYSVPDDLEDSGALPMLVFASMFGAPSIKNQSATIVSRDDLACFQSFYDLPTNPISELFGDYDLEQATCDLSNGCLCSGIPCLEPNLDVQMTTAMSPTSALLYGAYKGNFDTDSENYDGFITDLKNLQSQDRLPAVVSISYGSNEDLYDQKTLEQTCNEIGLLTAAGTTFFAASGDLGATNGECGTYNPAYLTSCPYITSVGGTFGAKQGMEVLATGYGQGESIISGGGFSDSYGEPSFDLSFQRSAVEKWLESEEAQSSLPGYNAKKDGSGTWMFGRAYPDISGPAANVVIFSGLQAMTIGGTSASCPIVAGLTARCTSRLDQDEVGFGWINPTIYENWDKFYDITEGNNQHDQLGDSCGPVSNTTFYGFQTAPGWDPASGVGTMGRKDGYEIYCNMLLGKASEQDGHVSVDEFAFEEVWSADP